MNNVLNIFFVRNVYELFYSIPFFFYTICGTHSKPYQLQGTLYVYFSTLQKFGEWYL